MAKVKKVLECVCFYCSRLKADKNSVRFTKARSLKEARSRLNAVWGLCKSKMICDGGEPADDKVSLNDEDYISGRLKNRGGCGHRQPIIRKEGLSLTAYFKATQHDVPNLLIS
jgi:DNA-directed RNA polymerase II subunit RPB1